jgi:D-alanine-D-alanine ligase
MEKKLKIAVLYESWGEGVEAPPPEPAPKKRRAGKKRKKREKHDREEIFEALQELGHEPSYYLLDGDEKSLTALSKCDADLFFNIVESYAGDDSKEMHVAAYLDLLGRVYTGAGPQALYLAQDNRRTLQPVVTAQAGRHIIKFKKESYAL